MVARISFGKSVYGAVAYNEEKVGNGQATFLAASGYWKQRDLLQFSDKVGRLQKLSDLNSRVDIKCMHVSLNFDPADNLDPAKIQQIAAEYMNRIGFGGQPYLVYQHHDAAHPHIHIVTTTIKTNRRQIGLHKIGQLKSEPARIDIEKKYGLIPASSKKGLQKQIVFAANIEKALYGKSQTKKAITNVVGSVLQHYSFTTLVELNAILAQFNVTADPGAPGSRIEKHQGLIYSLLDSSGNKVGVPIKASLIFGSPTLKTLRMKFAKGASFRKKQLPILKSVLSGVLRQAKCNSWEQLSAALKAKGIHLIIRRNTEGRVYGLTYVDNVRRLAINGSDIGPAYSANAVTDTLLQNAERLSTVPGIQKGPVANQARTQSVTNTSPTTISPAGSSSHVIEKITEAILEPVAGNYTPNPYKKKRRKKRKGLQL